MRKNKITALVLVCVMMFSIMATGFVMAAEEEIMPISESTSKFEDISGHWAEQTIINMTEKGIFKGQTETLFAPDANVTNAEFVAMCVRVANKEVTPGNGSFTDVTEGNWYYEEVDKAVAMGILEAGGEFKPNEPMNREDMAVVAYKTYGEDVEAAELDFSDKDEISADKAELVAKAVTAGLIKGMDTGDFQPKANMTRAQSATVIERLMELVSEEPTTTPSAEPTASTEPTPAPTEGCFPNEDWTKSGIKGPQIDMGVEKVDGETAYTDKTGASAVYYPGIERAGNINVYVYLIPQGEKDDTQMKVEVFFNGQTDEKIIDTSKEEKGYYYVGTYPCAGSAKEYEYVKVTRISEDDTYTRLSAIRFDFLGMTDKPGPNSAVNGQYIVHPYDAKYSHAGYVTEPTTKPSATPTGDVTEDTETTLENPDEWNRTFAEFFDGNAVNEEIWRIADKDGAGHTLCSRWRENVEVKDGNLHLLAKKEVRPIENADGTLHEQPFTCGSMSTQSEDWHYGYYEAKYKYAAATGTNNSFWLMSDGGPSKMGDSEIDINEGHYPYEMATNIHGFDPNQGGTVRESLKYPISAPQDLATEMNIFHLEWNAKELKFGCNGEIKRKAENKYCKNPTRMYLSLAVLDFAGEVTDAIDGTEMVVDWVKVYEKK